MSIEIYLAFCLFAFIASITPGPNNIMVFASGLHFGFRQTIPHILGICFGFFILMVAGGLGLAKIMGLYPAVFFVLKVCVVGYLLYLAWKIATAKAPTKDFSAADKKAKPMGVWGAAVFQWVNPKAWIMSIGTYSTYFVSPPDWLVILFVSASFACIALPCICVWVLAGQRLQNLLKKPVWLYSFNGSMAFFLVVSLYPILYV